jgi:hypothetical protein
MVIIALSDCGELILACNKFCQPVSIDPSGSTENESGKPNHTPKHHKLIESKLM